jgi:hypothetical protein
MAMMRASPKIAGSQPSGNSRCDQEGRPRQPTRSLRGPLKPRRWGRSDRLFAELPVEFRARITDVPQAILGIL